MTTTAAMTSSAHTTAATGPRTAAGKAISARNATTHGLFCRQTVLPHLGEDPEAYDQLLDTLKEQLRPRNLMETQYLELWADASWKLRRLSRLEAQVWEAAGDTPDAQDALLRRLERLARLQGGLRRQMDRAVRHLLRDLPDLFERRNREDLMEKMHLTEPQRRQDPRWAEQLEHNLQANRRCPDPPADLLPRLDNTAPAPGTDDDRENGQNEPAADHPTSPFPLSESPVRKGEVASLSEPEGVPTPPAHENRQNEPQGTKPAPAFPSPFPKGEGGRGTRPGGGSSTEGTLA